MSITATAALLAGILSFFSPCVLPLVPAYLSYMSGASVEDLMAARGSQALRRTGIKSLFFVLGFSAVFVLMGATATSLGQLLTANRAVLVKASGIIIVVFGLHMSGLFKIKALYAEKRFHTRLEKIGIAGSFLIGITFAFGWTPCLGPALGSIMMMAADSSTVIHGMRLLALYSIGLGIPFLAAGFATGSVLGALSKFKRHFRKIEIASGTLMVLVGALVFTGMLQSFSAQLGVWLTSWH